MICTRPQHDVIIPLSVTSCINKMHISSESGWKVIMTSWIPPRHTGNTFIWLCTPFNQVQISVSLRGQQKTTPSHMVTYGQLLCCAKPKAVTAYFPSEQLLSFGLARQSWPYMSSTFHVTRNSNFKKLNVFKGFKSREQWINHHFEQRFFKIIQKW